jgi:carboxypeptidase T
MPIPSEYRVRKNSPLCRLTTMATTLGLLLAASVVVAATPAAPKRTSATPAAAAAAGANDSIYDLLEQEKRTDNIFKAYFPSLDVARKAAISLHGQLLESNYKEGYLIVELDAADMDRLRPFGFRFERATEFIERRNRALTQSQLRQLRAAGGPTPNSISGYACYETVEETFAVADALLAAKPNLGTWVDAGNSWLKTQGAGGYDMRVLKLTNSAVPTPAGGKPVLFINSAIHAREYTTAPLSLEFARWLVNGHGNNADATWILDHHEVHLMLHTNPDGRKRAETGLSWRKNVNNNYCANSNTRGIDLNRNFSATWNSTGGVGSSGTACSLTYRGPSAGSEPETQAIESYIRSLWPDRRGPGLNDAAPADTSGVHLDIHSYSQLVLWPWGETNTPAPNSAALQAMGRRLAYFNGYTPQQSIGLYPTDGTSDSPSYHELGVASFTIELGTAFFESCAEYEANTKPGNLPALIYAAKVVRTPYITPGGPDVTAVSLGSNAATTGVVAGAWVSLSGSATDARFNNSNGVEATQAVAAAEHTIDVPPWQADAVPKPLLAADGSFDAVTEALVGQINTTGLSLGKHIVYVRARDASGVWGPVTASFLNISTVPTVVIDREFNDAFGAAQVIDALPTLVNGYMAASQRINRSGDIDLYRVVVPAGKTLTATLTPNASSDYNLKVHAANFVVVASSQLGTGLVDQVSVTNSSAVDVVMYVRVDFFSGLSDSAAATYALLMQIEP